MTTRWEQYKQTNGAKPWDSLNPSVSKLTEEDADKRYSICQMCPEFISLTTQCKKCGCIMKLKTKIEGATCPLEKW